MSKLSCFLKDNKSKRDNTTYIPTKAFKDENGNPIKWIIKPLSTREYDAIRDRCMKDVPVLGKPNQYTQKLDASNFNASLIAASVVEPNLNDAQLQDSYGVKTAKDLIREMIDNPGEYNDFLAFIIDYNGFTDINDDIEEAKN